MYKSFLSAAALLSCVACVSNAPTETIPDRVVGIGFIEGQLNWRGNGLDDITYAIGIFEEGGRYVVCGAAQSMSRSKPGRVLGALQVTEGNSVLVNSLSWLPHYSGSDGLNGKAATCRQTSHELVDDPNFDVKLTKTRFRRS